MKIMEREKESSVYPPRKLLEGEHVEIRQREVGLRGSWHLAKVVKVKHGRRVVEYEDLLTSDGRSKLCESIHLSKDLKNHSPSLRLKNGTPSEELCKRSLIRPIPPPCSNHCWKSGLLVDAFYDGAWWEGILLDDVLFDSVEFKVKVFFPDEGDELQFLVNDLRVSQEWDEESGDWEACGFWPFYAENGKTDISSLKTTQRGFSKKLWRQKRLYGLQDTQVEELKNLQSSLAQKQLCLSRGGEETPVQDKTIFCHGNNARLLKQATNQQDFQEPVFKFVRPSLSTISSKEGAGCDEPKLEVNGGFYQPIAQRIEQDDFGYKLAGIENKYGNGYPLAILAAEGKIEDRIAGGTTPVCRVTRSTLASVKQRGERVPLCRLHKQPNGCAQHGTGILEQVERLPLPRLYEQPNGCTQPSTDILEEEKLLFSRSSERVADSDLQPVMNSRKEIDSVAQQTEYCSSGPFPPDWRSCSNLQKNNSGGGHDPSPRDNGALLTTSCGNKSLK